MPTIEEHCKFSRIRTGKTYEDLHKWMDEPVREKGIEHRAERHGLNDIEYVRHTWGDEAVNEFMVHIILDFQDTKAKLEKLFRDIKSEKQKLIDDKAKLKEEFNTLLNDAQTMENHYHSGVEGYCLSDYDYK